MRKIILTMPVSANGFIEDRSASPTGTKVDDELYRQFSEQPGAMGAYDRRSLEAARRHLSVPRRPAGGPRAAWIRWPVPGRSLLPELLARGQIRRE